MPRIGRTDSWPIRNGKYHKEVVCVCVWSERLTANFKDLQTTLSLKVKKVVGGACLQCDHTVFESITKVSPLRFFGHKLTLVEQRYLVIERELLALLVGYKSSLHFVYGKHVIFLPLTTSLCWRYSVWKSSIHVRWVLIQLSYELMLIGLKSSSRRRRTRRSLWISSN